MAVGHDPVSRRADDVLLAIEVRREGSHLAGSVTRTTDQATLEFWGVLGLVAAVEQLEPGDDDGGEGQADA